MGKSDMMSERRIRQWIYASALHYEIICQEFIMNIKNTNIFYRCQRQSLYLRSTQTPEV